MFRNIDAGASFCTIQNGNLQKAKKKYFYKSIYDLGS